MQTDRHVSQRERLFLQQMAELTVKKYVGLWTQFLPQIQSHKVELIDWIDQAGKNLGGDPKKIQFEAQGIRALVEMAPQDIEAMVRGYCGDQRAEPIESMYHIMNDIVQNTHGLFK